RLLHHPPLILGIECLPCHLLGRQHGQVRDLLSDPLERAPRLGLDVPARGGYELLPLLLPGCRRLSLRGLGRAARSSDDLLGLLAGLLQALPVLAQELVGLLALPVRRLDALADRVSALVERVLDPRQRRP